MRVFQWISALLLPGAMQLSAQVEVSLLLDQTQFLRDESLPVKVRISNRSGQPLRFAEGDAWLTFSIERSTGAAVNRLKDALVTGEFSLESAEAAMREFDLMPCFELTDPGRYTVTAHVRIPQWAQEISSPPKTFELVQGTKIWEQDYGMPATNGMPELRRYALLQANNLKQLVLYARITNPEGSQVYRIVPLGRLVSFARPEVKVDRQSKLHVLFQAGARMFAYCTLSPEGKILQQDIYDYTLSRPSLKSDEQGKVQVSGGERRLRPDEELPPPPPVNDVTNAPVNTPKEPAKKEKRPKK